MSVNTKTEVQFSSGENEQSVAVAVAVANIIGDFGNGRYSKFASELFRDTQRIFGLTSAQADKVARAWMSDYGRAMSNAPVTGTSVKPGTKKDREAGLLSLKDAMGKIKATSTYSLAIAGTTSALDNIRKDFGCVESFKPVLREDIKDWLDGKEVKKIM